MQHAQAQFTPEQMIVAGRRAEAQGQPAHALQFYQYIADAFPSATEAYEARDAIYRLTDPHAGLNVPVATPMPAMAAPSLSDVRPAASLEAGPGPSHGRAAQGGKRDKRKRRPDVADEDVFEAPRSGYRIGRLVAAMLSTMGWLMLLGGVLLGPLMIVALTVKTVPKGIRETVAANLLATSALTFGAIFLGLLALFAAQTARATYDTADAVRDLLAARGAA